MVVNLWGALICASIYNVSGDSMTDAIMSVLFGVAAFIFSILGIVEAR